ncbi:MAG TPA: XrtA/PEP-CTERM system histidine kinase PrsK, partial [Nitrospiraceae bacterium]|nr:XrtA/PEP-CTERM system histidine kinase PrsK [Nitrospiraceae bacterium]
MMSPAWLAAITGFVAASAGGMACLLFARRQASSSHRSLASLLGATAVANLANSIGLLDVSHTMLWQEIAMVAILVQPAALLYVGLAFLNPIERGREPSALWRARITGLVGLLLALFAMTGSLFQWKTFENGESTIALSSWGIVSYVFIVIGMALGLAHLEVVLRASHEPVRHKLKFLVIGLGGLAGYQIYQASQVLLFPVGQAEHVLVSSVVTVLALGLIAYGLGRNRLREVLVNTYVSQQALLGSVTFIVIGAYLLAVGAVGEWLRRTDQSLGVGLSVVVVFAALVGLAIAVFSKTVRAEIRRFLTRNFYRSKYDYRAKWLQVTESFQQATHTEAIMDRLLDVLIKTFPTTTISIWSFRESDRRFFLVRSMTADKEAVPIELSHPVIRRLMEKDEAVSIKENLADPFAAGGARLCFPIRAQGRLRAFVVLGQQLHGEPYGTDEEDLLRGISHHVGTLLSHASLAEERQASAELEALHRFSVFCFHDLKNLAARLSLVAQNAENHGQDPAFQESVMRTVTDTATKMTALMSKLSLKTFKSPLVGAPELVEMSELIDEIVAPIRGDGAVRLHVSGKPVPPVMAVRDQIQQVLLNVVLNAKQAIDKQGDISIDIAQANGSIVVTVNDTGSGIPQSMLETLFRPSQSGRPGGLGIGLYQCKQIVEAHRGTIQIRSNPGQGSQVRI